MDYFTFLANIAARERDRILGRPPMKPVDEIIPPDLWTRNVGPCATPPCIGLAHDAERFCVACQFKQQQFERAIKATLPKKTEVA